MHDNVKARLRPTTLNEQRKLIVKLSRLNEKVLNQSNSKQNQNCKKAPRKLEEPKTPNQEFTTELKKAINERNILTTRTKSRLFNALGDGTSNSSEQLDVNKSNKEKTIMEIISSEKTYIQQLEIIIDYFMNPIMTKKLLDSRDYEIVFGNIMSIYYVNKELLKELDVGPHNLTKAFMKLSAYFKIYSGYACQFKDRLKILENAKTNNPEFAKFVENQETRPEVQNKLGSLLIAPIQRVPRYKLLLIQLQSFCDSNNWDKCFDDLEECISKVENAAIDINRLIGEQEHSLKLLNFQKYLKSGEPNMIKPGRKLLQEGILKRMSQHGKPSEKLYVVLMNDILVFNKMKKSNQLDVNSMKILYIFPLNKCLVTEVLDKGCLRIESQAEELILYHDELCEIKSWSDSIQQAIQDYLANRKTLRKESSGRVVAKRKNMYIYHENGLSPGKPLKKRKLTEIEPRPAATSTSSLSSIVGRNSIHHSQMSTITSRDQLRSNPETNHLNAGGFPVFQDYLEPQLTSNDIHHDDESPQTIALNIVAKYNHLPSTQSSQSNDGLLKKVGSSIMGWFGLTKKQ